MQNAKHSAVLLVALAPGCGKTLHKAVINGDVKPVRLLLDKGADVNAKDVGSTLACFDS